ncbi:MAG: GNAT family N-acetyltransferase [Muribaculaceae bacterium]|nr:GNAT family N-acetyltransferase [Muribaculaceae bacterium]
MTAKECVRIIWDECFSDPFEWKELFFERVFKEEYASVILDNAQPVSSMMLLPYDFMFQGEIVKSTYVYAAATRKHFRNKGMMTQLMKKALNESREKGNLFTVLIPASRELYFYYDRFDFSTVFFIKEERYTSVHRFRPESKYITEINPPKEIYEQAFLKLQESRRAGIYHGPDDLDNILWDLELDNGSVITVRNDVDDEVVGIGFVVKKPGQILVREVLATDSDAAEAILSEIRSLYGEFEITVQSVPDDRIVSMESRGMLRIVNVPETLRIIATANPNLSTKVKVSDSIIPGNNGLFFIDKGDVVKLDEKSKKLDLDVSVKTLAEILFNSPSVGNLFDLPSQRPFMSLMLE